MRKLLLICFLLFSSTALADQKDVCAEITVRFTVFSVTARYAKNETEFKSYWYKIISTGNAEQSTRQLLTGLVDTAWETRDKDVTETAMILFHGCTKGTTT
jgi:hypothetical protein